MILCYIFLTKPFLIIVFLLVLLFTWKVIELEIQQRKSLNGELDSGKREALLKDRSKWFLISFLVGVFILLPVFIVLLLTLIKTIS